MKSAKLWSRLTLALVAAGLMAAPALAKVAKSTQDVVLWGVDSLCSPDDTLGVTVSTKVYKDTHTGIITLSAKGKVTNECGCKITLNDLGVTLIDPCDGVTEYTATKDSESINAPKKCKCKCSSCDYTANATLVACYIPSCDCAPAPVPALR